MNYPNHSLSRRSFLGKSSAAAAVAMMNCAYLPKQVLGGSGVTAPSDKLNIAAVGIGGMGQNNLRGVENQNIVALCDVDFKHAAPIFKKYPKAKQYQDFRVMLEKQKDIDAVIVATPDHMHYMITKTAMELGKHVYTQKPLVRLVSEARGLTEMASKHPKIVTQMGNQGHSTEPVRLVYEYIKDGAIGKVREVHAWTNRPVWPQGVPRPTDTHAVPETLNWDLFLGVAPERPYHPAYHPFAWRGWYDFGAGAMGDMACHILDSVFFSLDLTYPIAAEASTSTYVTNEDFWNKVNNKESFPRAAIVKFEFPARGSQPPVNVTWYDGGLKPPRPDQLEEGRRIPDNGAIFYGDKGVLMHADGAPRLLPESAMREYKKPAKTLPRIETGHEMNWVNAIKNGGQASSHFALAAPMTEAILVGNIAVRHPHKKLKYDAAGMTIPNDAEANDFIKMDYRQGW